MPWVYTTSKADSNNNQGWTWTGINLGKPSPDRYIICAMAYRSFLHGSVDEVYMRNHQTQLDQIAFHRWNGGSGGNTSVAIYGLHIGMEHGYQEAFQTEWGVQGSGMAAAWYVWYSEPGDELQTITLDDTAIFDGSAALSNTVSLSNAGIIIGVSGANNASSPGWSAGVTEEGQRVNSEDCFCWGSNTWTSAPASAQTVTATFSGGSNKVGAIAAFSNVPKTTNKSKGIIRANKVETSINGIETFTVDVGGGADLTWSHIWIRNLRQNRIYKINIYDLDKTGDGQELYSTFSYDNGEKFFQSSNVPRGTHSISHATSPAHTNDGHVATSSLQYTGGVDMGNNASEKMDLELTIIPALNAEGHTKFYYTALYRNNAGAGYRTDGAAMRTIAGTDINAIQFYSPIGNTENAKVTVTML